MVPPQFNVTRVLHVTCPWGNNYRLYQAPEKSGPKGGLGLLYIYQKCKPQTATSIGKFYHTYFDADVFIESPHVVSDFVLFEECH